MGQGMSEAEKMQNQLFNLKFTAKQLNKAASKCEKEEKVEKKKLKTAIEKSNMEGARIYAQNAIRKKNEGMNYLRLSSRVDAVATRVEAACRMKAVTYNMSSISNQLDKAMKTMNLEEVSSAMDRFEKQFEDIDVQSSVLEQSIGRTTALATPENEVDGLIMQVAEEHGLSVGGALPSTSGVADGQQQAVEEDDLAARLAKLRG